MDSSSGDIAWAMSEAARSIEASRTLDETLDSIVRAAQDTVPGFSHAGISVLHRDGAIETLAGTDELVWELDSVQYSLMEGPCVDAMQTEPIVVVNHARHAQRWPRYMPAAVEAGLRSQLAVRLYLKDDTLGGLNLYSTDGDTVDPEAPEIASLFAAHAAIALGHAREEHHLQEALGTRKTIGQAIGIVMQQHEIDEDRAFHFLLRVSSTSNIKLRTIAQELVDEANRKFGRHSSP
jgi:GAF domain-containing protein